MPAAAPIPDDAFVAAFRGRTLTAVLVEAALPRDRTAAVFFVCVRRTPSWHAVLSSGISSPTSGPMATRDAARERFWRDTFTAWKAGGLTARDYCARHGLAETAFHHRQRELRRWDAAILGAETLGRRQRSLELMMRLPHE